MTFEAVAKVSNALVAEGLKPTVRAVRERLGGSNTTLVRHLRAWNEARSVLEHQSRDLPGELVLAMRRSLAAAEEAGRSQLSQQFEAAQQTADELAQENEVLCKRLEAAEAEAASVRSERDGLQGKLEGALESRERMEQELQRERLAAVDARSELARVTVRVEGSEREVRELRERERAARDSVEQLQLRQEELLSKVAAEQAARATLASQVEAERQRCEALRLRVKEANDVSAAHASAMERAAAAEAAIAELRRTVATLQGLLGQGARNGVGVGARSTGPARKKSAIDAG